MPDTKLTKKLIETAGRDGGFIMDSVIGFDDAKKENMPAMRFYERVWGILKIGPIICG